MEGLKVTSVKHSKLVVPCGEALRWRRRDIFQNAILENAFFKRQYSVMRVQKNVNDMLLGTLLDTTDKTKDTLNMNQCE